MKYGRTVWHRTHGEGTIVNAKNCALAIIFDNEKEMLCSPNAWGTYLFNNEQDYLTASSLGGNDAEVMNRKYSAYREYWTNVCHGHDHSLMMEPFHGRMERNIAIILNRTENGKMRRIVGIDIFSGKIVNIVDTKGIKHGFHYRSSQLEALPINTAIQAEFEFCPGKFLNTLKVVCKIRALGTTDLKKLRVKYIECDTNMDFLSSFNDVTQFCSTHSDTRGYAQVKYTGTTVNVYKYDYQMKMGRFFANLDIPTLRYDPDKMNYIGTALVQFQRHAGGREKFEVLWLYEKLLSEAEYQKIKEINSQDWHDSNGVSYDIPEQEDVSGEDQTEQALDMFGDEPDLSEEEMQHEISGYSMDYDPGTRADSSEYTEEMEAFDSEYKDSYLVSNLFDDHFATNFERSSASELMYLTGRHVPCIVHFTNAINLISIMEKGIVPRSQLPDCIVTDDARHDGHLDCTSVSISFPNYKMFYKKRQPNNGCAEDFVVLDIDPQVLMLFSETQLAYFPENAAKAKFRNQFEQHTGLQALKLLFSPQTDAYVRSADIPEYFTTNPQAEILLRGIVPPAYIRTIFVCSEASKSRVKAYLRGCANCPPVKVYPDMYQPRVVFEMWQNKWVEEGHYGY